MARVRNPLSQEVSTDFFFFKMFYDANFPSWCNLKKLAPDRAYWPCSVLSGVPSFTLTGASGIDPQQYSLVFSKTNEVAV